MGERMHRIPLCSILVISSVSACDRQIEETVAVAVPSEVVELRDSPSVEELSRETQVIVLGTGTPIPDPRRAGPGIAVIHKGEAYLFDVGAGVVQNATIARYRYEIPSLSPTQICCVFLTHLHNDHTQDFSELATTMWWRRQRKLRAWGPSGLTDLARGVQQMLAPDLAIRLSGNQPIQQPEGYRIETTEIEPGIVFEKNDLTVEAFEVSHGAVAPAFGFRIVTDDKTVVISGDTTYSEAVLEKARGVDVLIHEVISDSGLLRNSMGFQAYHRGSHTLASDLARLATEAKPKILVLYHGLLYGVPESVLVDEVAAGYTGATVLANDLDVF